MASWRRAWRRVSRWVGLSEEMAAFRGIRWRLVLWYAGVLTVALFIFGFALYAGMRRELIDPVKASLRTELAQQVDNPPAFGTPCPSIRNLYYVCYSPSGKVLYGSRLVLGTLYGDTPPLRRLENPSLPLAAENASSGTASATVDPGNRIGPVQLYAAVLVDSQTSSPALVVQIGQPVGDRLSALDTLLHLLAIFGALTLVFTSAGGIFLAARALQPARLAFARQRDFIADASHELRTPLTILRADAEVLLRGRDRLPPEDAAILEDVVAEASHMAALANSMLNLARLDSNDEPIDQDVVDLAGIARDIGRRIGPLAAERDVTVRVDVPESVLVIGDRMLLEQATIILADNAVKYNRPGGEVMIRAQEHGEQATLEVRDTGIGIPSEHLPRLGERFYRVDKARSREMGGAGLGISIARSIAVRHRGTLRLVSEPGAGTTATIVLPATHAAPRHHREPESPPAPEEEAQLHSA